MKEKYIFIALSSHHWSLTWASHATDISGVPSTTHSTWEGCWCQFHQCFLRDFFIQKIILQLFPGTFWRWQKDFGEKSTYVQKIPE